MKFTLKDYRDEAVRDVLINLVKGRKRWREDADKHAFSLTAATGADKTVMAAVFEALFHGDDNYDFDADPGAVVIWFSDDPSLVDAELKPNHLSFPGTIVIHPSSGSTCAGSP